MPDLVTLDELRTALGIDPTDTTDDAQNSVAIAYASRVIINETERAFGTPQVVEERTYTYDPDDGGYLDIDDATEITGVSLIVPGGDDLVLTSDEWVALPPRREDSPVYYYLALPGFGAMWGADPAMGFTRNLDIYAAEGRWRGVPTQLKVTGTWGWDQVPEDVKLAVIWTVEDWNKASGSEGLTSESIESYARGWGGRTGGTATQALPNRVRDLLSNYERQRI